MRSDVEDTSLWRHAGVVIAVIRAIIMIPEAEMPLPAHLSDRDQWTCLTGVRNHRYGT